MEIFSDYHTTHITPTHSFPTYQFYAVTTSSAHGSDTFRICILETLRWLRKRLDSFSELPDVLNTPEPENYADFSEEALSVYTA